MVRRVGFAGAAFLLAYAALSSYFMKPFNLERLTSAVDMLTASRAPDTIG